MTNNEWWQLIQKETVIIPLISAIIGGLIQSCISHFFTNKEVTREQQREAYARYLEVLQEHLNNKNNIIAFESFQKATNMVLLFANNRTARLINKYFSNSTTLGGKTLLKEEHAKAHDEIFKSMRKDLKLSNKNIGICALSRHDSTLKLENSDDK